MDPGTLTRLDATAWRIEKHGAMRVPGIIYADESLILGMDDKVFVQTTNVASLPGIVSAAYVMPDAHWGYGFPIGGVAAFDPDHGGVISAGGVGFDISCGVRTMLTGVRLAELEHAKVSIADTLFRQIPAGGATWSVEQGFGEAVDLERIEERGCARDARPECVSEHAKKRQRREMGTLGSGNHYLEVQVVSEIYDAMAASVFGLNPDEVVVTIHCGSRGLGHQIGSEYLKEMVIEASATGIDLPDRELACAPIRSDVGERYLGAMRAATNCALANRQILGHLARRVMRHFFPGIDMPLLFDVSHNTCKVEDHDIDGKKRTLFVHRKGATRAFGPGDSRLPEELRSVGQPVLIGGSMGTGSFILAGMEKNTTKGFSSACHGAGRAMSRHAAVKLWSGRQISDKLFAEGIVIRSPSTRGIAEEAPGAYKDVSSVVESAERAGLARRVARLRPVVCIKG
jgi:tRNA-splicing ligase RtcB